MREHFRVVIVMTLLVAATDCQNEIDLCEDASRIQCFCFTSADDSSFPLYDIDCSTSNYTFEHGNYTVPPNVYFMDFSSNAISDVSALAFLRGRSIIKLSLSKNYIVTIDSDVLYLPELIYLDLSDNHIESVDALFFKYTSKLKYIDLSGNQISNIALKTFNTVPDLNVLFLNDNPLGDEVLKYSLFQNEGLGVNPSIEILGLDGLGLNKLPENFLSEAFNLRHLSLERNNLSVFREFPFTLECLALSDNPITELDADDFVNNVALKELILNNLKIKKIDDYTFASLKSLEKLELKGNRNMTKFSRLAFGDDVLDDADDFNLSELSFRGSALKTLDRDLYVPFSRLSILDLQGNPWRCDCDLLWLRQFIMDDSLTEHVRCFQPSYAYNYKLFELPEDQFVCSDRYTKAQALLLFFVLALTTFLITLAFWLVFVYPKFSHRKTLIQNMAGVSSPYARIVIEPNSAEDYR